ncbi:MAG: hypothetical protein QOJ40_1856 [Verrucomicrobiota bacterium]
MRKTYFIISLASLLGAATAAATEAGLVMHFPMSEGSGVVLHDASDHGTTGSIYDAKWVVIPGGHALEFDGEKSRVDCGPDPAAGLSGTMTVMAWICPASTQSAHEPVILGRGFDSWLLTYYRDRLLYFYINSGGNNATATAPPSVWSHVAGVFDGKTLTVYVDGQLKRRSASKYPQIKPGGKFYLGGVVAGAGQTTDAFKGMIGEVKIFDRALAEAEIRAEFQKDGGRHNSMFALDMPAIQAAASIKAGGVTVGASSNGAVQIRRGKSVLALSSTFSFPGPVIGFHALPSSSDPERSAWRPRVTRPDSATLRIEAAGNFYSLQRTIRQRGERIEWEDTLRNLTSEPVGVLISHQLIVPEKMAGARAMGAAECPLVFLPGPAGGFGMVAEDDVGRLQFESSVTVNHATVRHSSFALAAGQSHTFRYAIYPLLPTGDIYDLINRVRRDWQSNFTIEGPFEFIDAFDPRFQTPQALAAYLQRKKLGLVALSPWLDYDAGMLDHILSRAEYKTTVQKLAREFHQIDPRMKVLGCIETDWVALFTEKFKDGGLLDTGTAAQVTKMIDESDSPWKDSIKRNPEGQVALEHYIRSGKPQRSLSVYPAPGNAQEKFLLEQAKYLIEEAGLDGIYIDEFNQSWNRQVRSYAGWDGVSVEINSATGAIRKKFVSCGLAGIESRLALMNYVLSRGKTFVANTWATSAREQSLPALRFWEMQDYVRAGGLHAGVKPAQIEELMVGLLGSPIGLGITAAPANARGTNPSGLAEGLMLGVISYLRHGLLYYHYSYPDLSADGPGAIGYGPINLMFPFTPVALHEGWMEGRERTITCVSGNYTWKNATKPAIHLFGLDGREKTNRAEIKPGKANWKISLPLQDWAEIAVISEK